MPRIPVIEQTTNVATSVPTTQAQGQQVISPIANAAQVASQGFDNIAQAEVYKQNALFHKENADAVANTGKPLSEADVYWKQYLVDNGQKTVDGGMVKQDDGSVVGFRAKAEKDFDAWSTDFMKGITNEKAKLYAQDHINRLRTQTLDTALSYEAQAGVVNRTQKVDEAVQTWASAAAKDDSNVNQLVLSAKTMIANSGFDERTRNEKAVAATKQIVEAAVTGHMERDPQSTKAALLKRYGVDPTAPLPAAAPSGSDAEAVTQTAQRLGISPQDLATVISYETGGKFSPSIRGGAGNKHIGLIQFGENEQKAYGASETQSFGDQMKAVEKYLKDRGIKPGDDLATIYRVVNGGNRDVSMQSNDGNGTIEQHVANMKKDHAPGADKFLGGKGSTAGSAVPIPPVVVSPALMSLVEQLPADRLPAYISASNTLVNQQQSTMKAQVTSVEADHLAAFQTGQTVKVPLTEAQYAAAFGPVEGPQRFANYKADQQLGGDISAMKAMPPDQMKALADTYRAAADPAQPGYAAAIKRYETVVRAATIVDQARQADPMAYAMQNGIGGAQPLNFNDTKAFGAEMNKRQGVASTMQSTYGAPFSLLSDAEAKTLSQGFVGMTTDAKLGMLNAIKTSVSDPAAYRAVMQQIAPDSPVTAMAGMILSKDSVAVGSRLVSADVLYKPREVAGMIVEGEALINPTKTAKGEDGKGKLFPMPKEQEIRDQFNSKVGKAFAGDPRGADFAYQAVKAYYAGKSARVGDVSGQTNSRTLDEAIEAVIGGVSDGGTGNTKVVRPWGMTEERFKDGIKQAFNDAIIVNGYMGTPADALGKFSLQNAGDGKYMLINGTGPLLSKDNVSPVVLDLNKLHRASGRASGGAVEPAPDLVPPATVVPEKAPKTSPKLPGTK